jgi:hypothetical protein
MHVLQRPRHTDWLTPLTLCSVVLLRERNSNNWKVPARHYTRYSNPHTSLAPGVEDLDPVTRLNLHVVTVRRSPYAVSCKFRQSLRIP